MRSIYFPAYDKFRLIGEVSDVDNLEHMQYVGYCSEDDQKRHLATIKGGFLMFTTLNSSNYYDRVLIEEGFKFLSIFCKADPGIIL